MPQPHYMWEAAVSHRHQRPSVPVVRIVAGKPPHLPEDAEEELTTIWSETQARCGGHLFDGPIFHIEEEKPGELTGYFVPYRYLLAVRSSPRLRSLLNLRPLCVSGCCLRTDGTFLLGKRPPWAASYPGSWELAPSGGLDASSCINGELSLVDQIHKELIEETGFTEGSLAATIPLGLEFDPETALCEYCFLLCLSEGTETPQPTEEYTEFAWIEKDAADTLDQPSFSVVPFSRQVLRAWTFD